MNNLCNICGEIGGFFPTIFKGKSQGNSIIDFLLFMSVFYQLLIFFIQLLPIHATTAFAYNAIINASYGINFFSCTGYPNFLRIKNRLRWDFFFSQG